MSIKLHSISKQDFISLSLVFCLALFSCSTLATQGLYYIEPPKYDTTDKFGVNVFGNLVTANLETVSIGGERGLSHSISPHTNLFIEKGHYGYTDKYAGGLRKTVMFGHVNYNKIDYGYLNFWVMRASFLGASADFIVVRDGTYQVKGDVYTSNYDYVALGDSRHTLAPINGKLVWTQPDGTEVSFGNAGGFASGNRTVEKITYPNGFTINTYFMTGVTTNTGFILKYEYVNDDPGLEASKIAYNSANSVTVPSVITSDSAQWRTKNPKYIRAINTAEEYCGLDRLDACTNLTKKWPKATFNWPGGMPRAIYIGTTVFSVENAAGGITEFHYEAQDVGKYDASRQDAYVSAPYTPGERIAPRLVAVKPAGATSPTIRYTYKNLIKTRLIAGAFSQSYVDEESEPGILTAVSGVLGSAAYSQGTSQSGMSYTGAGITVKANTQDTPGSLEEVIDRDKTFYFYPGFSNFVSLEMNRSGPSKSYGYDARENVEQINYPTNDGVAVTYAADYPDDCPNPKTCNKPIWVQDGRGNKTYYTYHQSGQIETVTFPADKNNKIAKIRYEYDDFTANFYQLDGTQVVKKAGSPIWLKTAEKTCTNGNTSGDACVDGDEVVTRYEYNHPNLFMTGMTVYSQKDNKTQRTCFQYDIYGNRIGETKPNANLSVCN